MTDVIRMGNKNIIELSSRIKKNIKLIYISTSLFMEQAIKYLKKIQKLNLLINMKKINMI